MNRSWKFEDKNMMEINSRMSISERENFSVSMVEYSTNFDWYLKNIVNGARKYFFKETEEDLIKARKKMVIFQIFHYILLFMIYTAVFYFGFRFLNQFSLSCVNYIKDSSSVTL